MTLRSFMSVVVAFGGLFVACSRGPEAQPNLSGSASTENQVIAQLFNWPFDLISAEIPSLAKAGYGAVHVSPPQLSNSANEWWGRYQPLDYRVIAGPLGSLESFKRMNQIADQHGIKIYVDVVLNHMANLGADHDLTFPPVELQTKYKVGPLFTAEDFRPAFCIRDWSNSTEVRLGRLCGGAGDTGLPDLQLESEKVLAAHKQYLKWLIELGADGFRLDAVKHMEPWYFEKLLTPDVIQGRYVFGEIIAGQPSFQKDLAPYLSGTSMSLYDFPLMFTMHRSFGLGGDLRELLEPVKFEKALSWDRAVTFVMNHDIPNNDGFRFLIMDETDEDLAYSFILGRDGGVPYIYSDLGRADGRDSDRWKNAHRRKDLVSRIKFHNAMQGTPQTFLHADPCRLLFSRGTKGLVAINKCDEPWTPHVSGGLEKGRFFDVLSKKMVENDGENMKFEIPPRSSALFLKVGR